ncbi:transmembrane protein [Cystoisospora suis]|uniref:Transmembrane protein n=1 Tax=Cystoisospora suis TaxID=483139 RepID=A0A2C6KKC1_9APIC|nr:transmembrane protein [Cystoisospora suis]
MDSGRGGGGDIFHPLLPTASSSSVSSSSASRVSPGETAGRSVDEHCPGGTQDQPRSSENDEKETPSPHDHRPGFALRGSSGTVRTSLGVHRPILSRDESVGGVSLSTLSSSTRAPRRIFGETSSSSDSQSGRLPSLSYTASTSGAATASAASREEREHDEKEETKISVESSPRRDKADSRRTVNTTSVWGSETKHHHHHTVSVQSSDYVAVTEATSTPGRACFICLEGVKRRKRDRKLVRGLLPCCSQCYAVVHQKCWAAYRRRQQLAAFRSRLLGQRAPNPTRCSICKTGRAGVSPDERVPQRRQSHSSPGGSSSSSSAALQEQLLASLGRLLQDEDDDSDDPALCSGTCTCINTGLLLSVLMIDLTLIATTSLYPLEVLLLSLFICYNIVALQLLCLAVKQRRESLGTLLEQTPPTEAPDTFTPQISGTPAGSSSPSEDNSDEEDSSGRTSTGAGGEGGRRRTRDRQGRHGSSLSQSGHNQIEFFSSYEDLVREAEEAAYDEIELELERLTSRGDRENRTGGVVGGVGPSRRRSTSSSSLEDETDNWIASSARTVWMFFSRGGTGGTPREQDVDLVGETRRHVSSEPQGDGNRVMRGRSEDRGRRRGDATASLLFRGVEMQLLDHVPTRTQSFTPSEELYV